MAPAFLSARNLADRLDVSYSTLLTWVRRGRVPHIRDGRGRLLFNLNSVLESLRETSRSVSSKATGQEVRS
jgi:excisionase family DNA binding protein